MICILTIILLFALRSTPLSKPYNDFLLNKAIETKDTTYCDKMTNMGAVPGPKHNCIISVALSSNDITICDNIELRAIPTRGSCYLGFALQKEDDSYCYNSDVDSVKNYCLEMFEQIHLMDVN